jgi:sec-independent protein translocase protein TatA
MYNMVTIQPLFIGPIGPFETALIFMAVVLLFGADRIPKLAKSMGESLQKFEQGKKEAEKEVQEITEDVESTVQDENGVSQTSTEESSSKTDDSTDENA